MSNWQFFPDFLKNWLKSIVHLKDRIVTPLVRISAFCFLQCFNTISWVTGRISVPQLFMSQFVPVSLRTNEAGKLWGLTKFSSR